MKLLRFLGVIGCLLLIFFPVAKLNNEVFAEEKISVTSAMLIVEKDFLKDERTEKLEIFLKSYNSPMSNHAKIFIEEADKNEIDWKLLPAISGIESSFGRKIPFSSYNPFGWANGTYRFRDWEEAISLVSGELKKKYVDRGATTVDKIAAIYCPRNYIVWRSVVSQYMKEIEDFDISSLAPFLNL